MTNPFRPAKSLNTEDNTVSLRHKLSRLPLVTAIPRLECTENQNAVSYLSAAAGGGKTMAIATYIADEVFSSSSTGRAVKMMYSGPSKTILAEMQETLEKLGIVDVYRIDSDTVTDASVTREIMRKIQFGVSEDCVILCTHQARYNLPYFHDRYRWREFTDEIPQLDFFYDPLVSHNAPLLKSILKLEPYNELHSRVCPRSQSKLDKFIRNADDSTSHLLPLLMKIRLQNQYDVLTPTVPYENQIERADLEDMKPKQVHFLALLKPELFHGTTIVAANCEKSMLYDHLKRSGCQMISADDLKPRLRYTSHPDELAGRVKVRYLLEHHRYSKTLAKKMASDGIRTVKQAMDDTILKHISGRPFLLTANKGDDGALAKAPNATLLPYNVEGLNSYDTHTSFVFFAAYNRQPQHQSFLESVGFTRDILSRSTNVEKAYQASMRTAIRNPNSSDHVEFIVPDRHIANEIADIIGCKNVERLGNVEPEPPAPKDPALTSTQKNKRRQHHQWLGHLFGTEGHSKSVPFPLIMNDVEPINQEDDNDISSPISPAFILTLHRDHHDYKPAQFTTEVLATPKSLAKKFRQEATTFLDEKAEGVMFQMSTFDHHITGQGYRTLANFSAAYGLVLDFDDGTMTPEMFSDMFWNNAGESGKRSHIIANSFSRSPERPNRFRAIMPFKTPVRSLEHFRAVYDGIMLRFEIAGMAEAETGLDRNSRTGNQSFYMPCTNRKHPAWAFCRCYGMSNAEFAKHGIEPKGYIKSRPAEEDQTDRREHNRSDRLLDSSTQMWIEDEKARIASMSEGRNLKLFILGSRLKKLNLPDAEIEAHLFESADRSNDPRKLREKAVDVMRSLKK